MQKNLEQTIIDKINTAKVATQEKYFKQFVSSVDSEARLDIGAKMNALDNVTFDLIKAIRNKLD